MAARKTALRPVRPDEKAPPTKPKTVTEAAKSGTTRELLVAMRERVATAVENPNTPARDLAAITNRLMQIVREIEALDAREDEEAARTDASDEDFDSAAI